MNYTIGWWTVIIDGFRVFNLPRYRCGMLRKRLERMYFRIWNNRIQESLNLIRSDNWSRFHEESIDHFREQSFIKINDCVRISIKLISFLRSFHQRINNFLIVVIVVIWKFCYLILDIRDLFKICFIFLFKMIKLIHEEV